jgi:mono/diheme cytochrome c family protein
MALNRITILACSITLLFVLNQATAEHFRGHVDVTVGQLSDRAVSGQKTFNENCADCHGVNGAGTNVGPPLIHDIYNPGHHSNESFNRAVTNGVQQHHWPYGDMPPQKHIRFVDMIDILTFVREVQQQNGITYRKHRM